ncbi:RNA 2',3'-cyclic phosphodiesterase [Nocardiopsis sp. NPDC006938]|uniref:RNA 2',3'-cyclic phosphodiesterase n=1 Tax=Nocardiopsis sp. NPDC006938 TaxID=3364337 RepID=UPI00368BB872
MPLFVALWPPGRVRDHLRRAVREARPTAPDLRWSPPQGWHLTLVFLGDPGDRTPRVAEALERALEGRPPLDLTLDGWGVFPRPDEPDAGRGASVVWAGVRGDGLTGLATDLADSARRAGVPVSSRPFVPHVTLARSRRPHDVTRTLRALGPAIPTGWRADRVDLVESRPSGPDRYRTVRSWGLPWGSESQRAPERGTS